MPTIREAIEHLETFDPDEGCAIHLWTEPDVMCTAEAMNIEITEEEAREILDTIHEHVDCEYGITWESLRCTIDDFDRDRGDIDENKDGEEETNI